MKKILNFCGKKYVLENTAYTIIKYQLSFNRDIFEDYQEIAKELSGSAKNNAQNIKISKVLLTVLRVFYVLQNKENLTFEEFANGIKFKDITNPNELKKLIEAIGELFSTESKKKQKSPNKK